MPKKAKELSALALQRITKAGLHAVGGCDGLLLQVTPTARTWVLRYRIGTKRRSMGLGGYPAIPLADARRLALAAREKLRNGTDPIDERQTARAAIKSLTFDQCAAAYIEAHRPSWKNAKHADQWGNTIERYASPFIGKLPVNLVDTPAVMKCLQPIWTTKAETAFRLRGRIEAILGWATTAGYRTGDNPARWQGHLENLLANGSRRGRIKNQPSLPYQQMGAFMAELRQREGVSARALEFAILTATRSGEVRGAQWSEFDLKGKVWTIPADRMKAGKAHTVPLSDAALAILDKMNPDCPTVFPNTKGAPLSDAALSATVDRMNTPTVKWIDPTDKRPVVPHGFRSTLRMWAAEQTNYPRDVAEHALAHKLPDQVEAAYQRGSLLGKRTLMMQEWANYCAKPQSEQSASGNVVALNAA